MVTSDAGREYRMQEVATDARGGQETYYTCLTCGVLVGPMRKHRDLHDRWHVRHGDTALHDQT